jgi:hypothetical protein
LHPLLKHHLKPLVLLEVHHQVWILVRDADGDTGSRWPSEIDHVGAVVHVAITSRAEWSAEATLFAVSADGSRITATHASMGAAGPSRGIAAITKRYAGPPLPEDPDARRRVLDAYRVQRHDVEDAMNQLLGRDPEMHRAPRLSWGPLIELLAEHGKVVAEEELIAMPFVFEFPAESLAAFQKA